MSQGNVRTLLVTGAASGIGRALVGRLLRDGHQVLAADVARDALEAAAQDDAWPSAQILLCTLDVRDAASWEEAIVACEAKLGPVDVLVNVAGCLTPGWVHEISPDAIDRMIDVNIKGVIFGMRAVTPSMVARKSGHVVNVASLAALAPIPGLGVYSATKYAVRSYSLSAAQELARRGVNVTVVCPDAVKTPMLDLQRDYDEAVLTFSGPRFLEAEEVVSCIVDDALVRAPLEIYLPRSRGLLARVADIFPSSMGLIRGRLIRRGRARQGLE